jgi:N utilization substance protein B
MSRRESREAAFKFLYQLEFRNSEDTESQQKVFLEEFFLPEPDVPFFEMIVEGVHQNKETLDMTYAPFLVRWKLDRIPKTDLVLLRIATFELLFVPEIPMSVSISEAVILAKRYSTIDSKRYINAILGKIVPGPKE